MELAAAFRKSSTAAPKARSSSDSPGDNTLVPPSSPPQLLAPLNTPEREDTLRERHHDAVYPSTTSFAPSVDNAGPSIETPWRKPSFLREANESTTVLRSLYTNDEAFSTLSLPRSRTPFSNSEDPESYAADNYLYRSPSLSVLSKSSFLSVYGEAKNITSSPAHLPPLDDHADEDRTEPISSTHHLRIHNWMDDKGTPTRRGRSPQKVLPVDHVSSIGQILGTPVKLQKRSLSASHGEIVDYVSRKPDSKQHSNSHSPSLAGPIFGHATLPPTPGTFHTSLANDSTSVSVVEDQSLRGGVPTLVNSDSSLILNTRLHTADSQFTHNIFTTTENIDGHIDDHSEDEWLSTRPEYSDHGGDTEAEPLPVAIHSTVETLTPSTQPASTPYGMNMIFNGDDYSPPNTIGMSYTYYPTKCDYRRRSIQPLISQSPPRSLTRADTVPLIPLQRSSPPRPSLDTPNRDRGSQSYRNPHAQHY